MSALETIGGIIGGGVLGIAAKAASEAYAAKRKADVELAKTEARGEQHEREVTERFALDALEKKSRAEDVMREQSAQITDLSVKVAHCEEQHKATQIELDLTRQLSERQRTEIDRQSVEIARLNGEVNTLNRAHADLRDRFDRLVERLMGSGSIPPGAPAE